MVVMMRWIGYLGKTADSRLYKGAGFKISDLGTRRNKYPRSDSAGITTQLRQLAPLILNSYTISAGVEQKSRLYTSGSGGSGRAVQPGLRPIGRPREADGQNGHET